MLTFSWMQSDGGSFLIVTCLMARWGVFWHFSDLQVYASGGSLSELVKLPRHPVSSNGASLLGNPTPSFLRFAWWCRSRLKSMKGSPAVVTFLQARHVTVLRNFP